MDLRIFKPKSYQIRWLDGGAANALLAAGIPIDPNDEGIFVQAADLPRVLTTLNMRVVATFPSPFKRIDEVVLSPEVENRRLGAISIDGASESTQALRSVVSVIAGELLPVVKRDIVIHLAGGASCAPIADGRFHIFMDSAASATEHKDVPEQIFSIPLEFGLQIFSRKKPVAYKPTGRGGSIVDWNTGFTAAEIVDDCLYIHFDILSCRPIHTQLGLLARILKKTADQLLADQLLVEVLRIVAPERENLAPSVPIRFDKVPRHFARQTLSLIGSLLSLQVNKPIVVHMEAGAQKAIDDGEFHLFLPGSPAKTSSTILPLRIFDVVVTAKTTACALASGATPVTDDAGFVVAQLVGMNNLFVSFNPINDTADGVGNIRLDWELLGRILKASLKELDVDSIVREIISEENALVLKADNPSVESGRCQVAVQGFSDRPLALVTALTSQLLAPAVGGNVKVSDGRGENHEPVSDGLFRVFFQASPLGEQCAGTPAEVFGVTLPTRERAFWPSGKGIAIADGAGFLAGELVENNLYIHAKLVHHGTRSEAKLLTRLMTAVLRERATVTNDGTPDNARADYQLHCFRRVKARLDNLVNNPLNVEEVRLAETAVRKAIAEMRISEGDLLRLEVSEQFGREYDELLAISKVRDVTVGGGQIIVDTNTLYCVDDRTGINHEIGAFKIYIPTEGGRLKWLNQTRKLNFGDRTMNAPHVGADGHACEGTTKDEWPTFIAQRQFAYVVMKAIQFIESANTGDVWGKGVSRWPVAAQR